MTRSARNPLVFALVLLLSVSAAWAQPNTAELNGQVTDSSGGVLPGVTVTATQVDTALTRTVVTDGTGSYVMTALPTGPYQLEVSLQGFRSYLQTGLVLTVGATPTVNVELELGSLEETITVIGDTPLVDVRSAGISAVVENEQILGRPGLPGQRENRDGQAVVEFLASRRPCVGCERRRPNGDALLVGVAL